MTKYDLISIGDPTVDTFLKIHDGHVAISHKSSRRELHISYANKIPVDMFFRFPAGNMPNNAIGAARLGMTVVSYGEVGDDGDGRWIREELKREGVETRFVRTDEKRSTNYSSVLVFQKERTIFVWHQPRDYKLPVLPVSEWLYLTSMGPLNESLERLHRQILGYLKTRPTKLAFNPGTYQLMMGRECLSPLLQRTETCFLNKEETQELTGKNSSDIKVLLRAFKNLGPQTVVITDGPKGSYAYDGQIYLACGIYDLPVVERTGAGDSYGTGFMAAKHYNLPLAEAMRWGTFNAAHVVGQFGGILGLIDKKTMVRVSSSHPELKVREI